MLPDSNPRRVLHIVTRHDDTLATTVIDEQRRFADVDVRVIDISREEPDYAGLLEEIFAADSVAVW